MENYKYALESFTPSKYMNCNAVFWNIKSKIIINIQLNSYFLVNCRIIIELESVL